MEGSRGREETCKPHPSCTEASASHEAACACSAKTYCLSIWCLRYMQALAMQQMQQLHADLLVTQARLAAAGARAHEQTQSQLQQDMQKLAMLSATTRGWNLLPGMHGFGVQLPALGLFNSIAPQFSAAAASETAAGGATASEAVANGSQAALQSVGASADSASSSVWSSAVDAAAQWRDSMNKLLASSTAWWPWGGAA